MKVNRATGLSSLRRRLAPCPALSASFNALRSLPETKDLSALMNDTFEFLTWPWTPFSLSEIFSTSVGWISSFSAKAIIA